MISLLAGPHYIFDTCLFSSSTLGLPVRVCCWLSQVRPFFFSFSFSFFLISHLLNPSPPGFFHLCCSPASIGRHIQSPSPGEVQGYSGLFLPFWSAGISNVTCLNGELALGRPVSPFMIYRPQIPWIVSGAFRVSSVAMGTGMDPFIFFFILFFSFLYVFFILSFFQPILPRCCFCLTGMENNIVCV